MKMSKGPMSRSVPGGWINPNQVLWSIVGYEDGILFGVEEAKIPVSEVDYTPKTGHFMWARRIPPK